LSINDTTLISLSRLKKLGEFSLKFSPFLSSKALCKFIISTQHSLKKFDLTGINPGIFNKVSNFAQTNLFPLPTPPPVENSVEDSQPPAPTPPLNLVARVYNQLTWVAQNGVKFSKKVLSSPKEKILGYKNLVKMMEFIAEVKKKKKKN
jgi:hypothetical protein